MRHVESEYKDFMEEAGYKLTNGNMTMLLDKSVDLVEEFKLLFG